MCCDLAGSIWSRVHWLWETARKGNAFLLFSIVLRIFKNCYNFGTTGLIQVGISTKCTFPNEGLNEIEKLKMSLVRLLTDSPLDRITYGSNSSVWLPVLFSVMWTLCYGCFKMYKILQTPLLLLLLEYFVGLNLYGSKRVWLTEVLALIMILIMWNVRIFCCRILLCACVHMAVLFSDCTCTVQQTFAAIISFIFTFYIAFVLRMFYRTKYSYCMKY